MDSTSARLTLPTGDEITVKLVDHGSRIIVEPVSGNPNKIHHHFYQEYGEYHLLIRDREGFNIAAFVLSNGNWRERSLTNAEQSYQQKRSW